MIVTNKNILVKLHQQTDGDIIIGSSQTEGIVITVGENVNSKIVDTIAVFDDINPVHKFMIGDDNYMVIRETDLFYCKEKGE